MLTRKIQGDSMLFYKDNTLVLTIEETDSDGSMIMSFKGDLVGDTAHHIQDELDAFTTVGVKVILDFKEVTYLAASVLNALLNAQQLIDFFRHGKVTRGFDGVAVIVHHGIIEKQTRDFVEIRIRNGAGFIRLI